MGTAEASLVQPGIEAIVITLATSLALIGIIGVATYVIATFIDACRAVIWKQLK